MILFWSNKWPCFSVQSCRILLPWMLTAGRDACTVLGSCSSWLELPQLPHRMPAAAISCCTVASLRCFTVACLAQMLHSCLHAHAAVVANISWVACLHTQCLQLTEEFEVLDIHLVKMMLESFRFCHIDCWWLQAFQFKLLVHCCYCSFACQ